MDRSDTYLLKPAEVVQLLGVSRSWLYEASKSGRIPCIRLGGADGPVRFEARELQEWLEQSRATVKPAGREGDVDAPAHDEGIHRRVPRMRETVEVAQLRLIPPPTHDDEAR